MDMEGKLEEKAECVLESAEATISKGAPAVIKFVLIDDKGERHQEKVTLTTDSKLGKDLNELAGRLFNDYLAAKEVR